MTSEVLSLVTNTIDNEMETLEKVRNSVDDRYHDVIDAILACRGKVIFMGVGKSGLIGRKLAATFSSTGTPAFFVHATESVHGDLGMIEDRDIVILISNSGETREVLAPLPSLQVIGAKTIAFTGNLTSSLAEKTDLSLLIPIDKEADALNLAPTASSTAVLVVGDAIACTISELKKFSKEDLAIFHPGGSLGKKLTQ
ncbi:KpsF/GutQ family sugar-phosphate isomerase [Lactiplantibacillus pentosus]|uniref:KpsF/GutQ family sugar-phosphate isomerase n=1 Tax=Lactiplantibacillus pentosus TaxID=1589 RepID=UPI001C1FC4B6|nr:SIS domain-containing protein [Lactiplantibacillus pentosus]MBU7502242.1 SIS domain-containing protein [Lactiplantibacillus pentosus]MDY1543779.1 SIS domain-containing protein [Lactiplantibacillus pentosus]